MLGRAQKIVNASRMTFSVVQTVVAARIRFKSAQTGMSVLSKPGFSRFGKLHYNAYESVSIWRKCIIVHVRGKALKRAFLDDLLGFSAIVIKTTPLEQLDRNDRRG